MTKPLSATLRIAIDAFVVELQGEVIPVVSTTEPTDVIPTQVPIDVLPTATPVPTEPPVATPVGPSKPGFES